MPAAREKLDTKKLVFVPASYLVPENTEGFFDRVYALCAGIYVAAAEMITMRVFVRNTIALLVGVVLASCSRESNSLSRTDIQLAAGDLRTFGYSTQLLIGQCSDHNATTTFCQEQSEFLSDKVEDAIRELDGRSSDVEYERKQLAEIGVNLHEILMRIGNDAIRPSDTGDAERLGAISKSLEDNFRK